MTRPIKVAVITPNPTPYRTPFFRLAAASGDIDLKIFFLTHGSATRPWHIELGGFDYEFLEEYSIPVGGKDSARYRINPGIIQCLARGRFDVVVVAGYNHFTTQAAILYCTATHTPWCMMSESHERKKRGALKTTLKNALLGPFLSRMGAAMVTGTLAARYVAGFGVPPEAIFVVANTPDVHALMAAADKLAPQRDELRTARGLSGKRVILFVGRLLDEKGLSVLFDAYAAAARKRDDLALVIAGDGPRGDFYRQRADAERLPNVCWLGFVSQENLPEVYAAADIFVLPSLAEPWGVVVNEAMASGLPVVVSDQVGASADLVRDGENGFVVPAGDAVALEGRILDVLADDRRRQAMGRFSRRIISGWDYQASVEQFHQALKTARRRKGRRIG